MTATDRTAVLARMVDESPKKLGRTAVMKLMYFLQEQEGISLGYDFRLFTYGPFDADVLSDLAAADAGGVVVEKLRTYARGYGYELTPTEKAKPLAGSLPPAVAAKVDQVVGKYAGYDASELELRSTIHFADREAKRAGEALRPDQLAERVHYVKPHFTPATILDRVNEMRADLRAVAG